MEKEAFEYSGASAYLLSCPGSVQLGTDNLEVAFSDTRANVFRLDKAENVRVVTAGETPYACDYGFTTAADLNAQMQSAIELTVRLGEFANLHIYPLK